MSATVRSAIAAVPHAAASASSRVMPMRALRVDRALLGEGRVERRAPRAAPPAARGCRASARGRDGCSARRRCSPPTRARRRRSTVAGREREDVLDLEIGEGVDTREPAEHVGGVGEIAVLQRDAHPLVGRGDAADRALQAVLTVLPRAAQAGDEPIVARRPRRCGAGAATGRARGCAIRVGLVDHAARVIAVGPHDERVHAAPEGVDVAELPRDLRRRARERDPAGCGRSPEYAFHSAACARRRLEVEPRELVPERVVDAALAGDGDLAAGRHDEVVAPEAADRLAGVLLDRHPERVLDLALLGVRETHQHVVVDQLVVAQRLARWS